VDADSILPPQGFVNLDKPAGLTSRKASDLVGRLFGRVETGHAGTLDPLATGVLPVAVGGATRLAELVSGADKEYLGRVRLGLATDTDDADGRPLGPERPVTASRPEVETALAGFRGEVLQRPPDYSALKRGGRAAHELARAGQPAELEPRPAVYRELELLAWEPPELELRARVSKGTYIRALARDLGERLGCGGHLVALRRTRAGAFRVEEAVTLVHLEELAAEGRAGEALLPAAAALPELVRLAAREERALYDLAKGRALPLAGFETSGAEPRAGALGLALDSEGRAVCLAELVAGPDGALLVQPRKRLR
jgi:tRNA pseudouridine55 synthase